MSQNLAGIALVEQPIQDISRQCLCENEYDFPYQCENHALVEAIDISL